MIISMQSLSGETIRERRRRERREVYELKVAEWEARLQLTDDLIKDLKVSSKTTSVTQDIEKIEELLNSPPNKTPTKDSNDLTERRPSNS